MKRHKENGHPNYQASHAKRNEIPYQMQLTARLMLDNLCYEWNHTNLVEQINYALDTSNEEMFRTLSQKYQDFINKK